MQSFADAPAVVAAFDDHVHFLPFILTDVAGPKLAGLTIEAHPPGIAHPVRPDFLADTVAFAGKRIVRRYAVGQVAGARVDIDPEDFSKQGVEILAEVVRIVGAA